MRPARKTDVFDAVAHPVRRRILVLLRDGSLPVGELAAPFRISLAAVSQHLKVLREADLVSEERRGRQVLYSISPAPLREMHAWIEEFGELWNARLDALERHLDKKHPRAR